MDPWNLLQGVVVVCTVMPFTSCARTVEQLPVESAGDSQSVDASALEQFVTTQLEELHIPGLAVAIVDEGGVLFSAGYGWADLANRVPMTPDTVINVAAISKTVTNAAVLQLRDQGLLDLDDDVN